MLCKYWWCPEPPRATQTVTKGFSNAFSPQCSGVWVSVLLTGTLGTSVAQKEVVVPTSPAPEGPGVIVFPAPASTSHEDSPTVPNCSWAQTLCQRLLFALCLSLLLRPPFPIILVSLQKDNCSHLLRNWPSISKWLSVHLHLNCYINLNWLNCFSKPENKNTDLKKIAEANCLWNWFLSSSRAQGIPEWISHEMFSCREMHAAGLR